MAAGEGIRRKRRKIGLWTLAGFLGLAACAAGFIYSPWFFEYVVLPPFERSLRVEVTQQRYSQGWFRELIAHGVEIRPRGADGPAVKSPRVYLDYNPWVLIFKGNRFRNIDFADPEVYISVRADGSSTLAPVFREDESEEKNDKEEEGGRSFWCERLGMTVLMGTRGCDSAGRR